MSEPTYLSNPKAPRVRAVHSLATPKGREKHGTFLVEGKQPVLEAIAAHAHTVRIIDIYLTEAAANEDEFARIDYSELSPQLWLSIVSEDVMAAMASTVNAQGALAVCQLLEPDLEEVLSTQPKLIAVLCEIRDPGNAGTIIRVADSAGADAVILTKRSVDVLNPKTVRSTAGSLFHLPVVAGVDFAELVGILKAQGINILAADGYGREDLDELQDQATLSRLNEHRQAKSEVQAEISLSRPSAWLFGNEAAGLREEHKQAADAGVAVPSYGDAESLNVATAATLCLYASARAQRTTQ